MLHQNQASAAFNAVAWILKRNAKRITNKSTVKVPGMIAVFTPRCSGPNRKAPLSGIALNTDVQMLSDVSTSKRLSAIVIVHNFSRVKLNVVARIYVMMVRI